MLDQTTEVNLLYDFYGVLLTAKQQKLLELYYQEDWSLSEIAEHQEVSRQAIFEAIKRAQVVLSDYEAKLGLLAKYRERQAKIQQLQDLLKDIEKPSEVETILTHLLELD
ncbi:YlxM family DNA-binding protein [Risungbinella massiliensis]|uniref:YlxM family DNA-binding protein n=1 Tax=Risungbinella massiliensis TaxID=1329796 RepID=UPI00164DA6D2|nr:YlxM family DNA-binding protein [Risungbinella massiliensis]